MGFGKNIKKIRTIKKLSQSAFAELFDITRSSVGAYEEGRAEPKLEMIMKIAKHFNISVDSLVSSDITVNELAHFKKLDDYLLGASAKENSKTLNVKINSIPLVSVKAIVERQWNDLLKDTSSQISLPNVNSNLLAFLFHKDDFEFAPQHFKSDDVVLISESEVQELRYQSYYIVVLNKKLRMGELKPLGKSKMLLVKPNQDIEEINTNKIQAIYIVEKHIVNHPVVVDDASEKIKKLERLVHDLYHRLE